MGKTLILLSGTPEGLSTAPGEGASLWSKQRIFSSHLYDMGGNSAPYAVCEIDCMRHSGRRSADDSRLLAELGDAMRCGIYTIIVRGHGSIPWTQVSPGVWTRTKILALAEDHGYSVAVVKLQQYHNIERDRT